jgi:acetoacetate decarboxylase
MKRNGFSLFLVFLLLSVLPACSPNNVSDKQKSFQPEIEAFSMPWAAPFIKTTPRQFRDNHRISVVFQSEMGAISKFIPPPLIPNPDGQMFFYIGQSNFEYPVNEIFSFHEAGIGIPVTFQGNPGYYFIVLYVDEALPIVEGREIWGFPKKDAHIVYEETKEKISAQVNRLGTVIAELTASLGEEVQPIPDETPTNIYNLKIIPSVKKGAPPDVMQLTSYNSIGKTLSLRTASQISLKFSSTSEDPLGEIRVLDIVGGSFKIRDVVTNYGEVLYDYLKPSIPPDIQ